MSRSASKYLEALRKIWEEHKQTDGTLDEDTCDDIACLIEDIVYDFEYDIDELKEKIRYYEYPEDYYEEY